MGNKTNMAFFNAYIELDNVCARALDVKKGGVSAYIGRLVESRFAPGRSEILPKLVEYRKIRNAMAHEEGALTDITEITKADVQWISRFAKQVQKKKDPISQYTRKANRFALMRTIRIILLAVMSVGLATVIFMILKTLNLI